MRRGAPPAFPSRRCRTRSHRHPRSRAGARSRVRPATPRSPSRSSRSTGRRRSVGGRSRLLEQPRRPAFTARSLTCSSAAAMCLPRRPNFRAGRPRGCRSRRRPRRPSSTARAGTPRSRPDRRRLTGAAARADRAGMIVASSASTSGCKLVASAQRIQRIPTSSPIPISAHASTSGSPLAISPSAIAWRSPATYPSVSRS